MIKMRVGWGSWKFGKLGRWEVEKLDSWGVGKMVSWKMDVGNQKVGSWKAGELEVE